MTDTEEKGILARERTQETRSVRGQYRVPLIVLLVINIAVLIAGLLICGKSLICSLTLNDSVTDPDSLQIVWEEGGMDLDVLDLHDGCLRFRVTAHGAGKHVLAIMDENGEYLGIGVFVSDRFGGAAFKNSGEFSAGLPLGVTAVVFLLSYAMLFFHIFYDSKRTKLYSYVPILTLGCAIFFGVIGLELFALLIWHLREPDRFVAYGILRGLCDASLTFISYTFFLIVFFGIALIVSNIFLLRHEGRRLKNMLGIAVGFLMIGGLLFCIAFDSSFTSGSMQEYRLHTTASAVISTLYAYFECMLLSAAICGLRAAKQRPPLDRDYILILGCGFSKDGTLPPLLRGRADAALAFREKQLAANGREVIFVPSGGQGADEPFAEAEAIRRYLLEKGVPESAILKEDKSKTTLQNMVYSKKLIETQNVEANIAFATTNYHVFRSGIWAQTAGLDAEGIGSKTAWWYWPNAFLRECLALMQKRILFEAMLLIASMLFFGTISMILIQ